MNEAAPTSHGMAPADYAVIIAGLLFVIRQLVSMLQSKPNNSNGNNGNHTCKFSQVDHDMLVKIYDRHRGPEHG